MEIYDVILRDYVRDLREAKQRAESWWTCLIEDETSRSSDRDAAVTAVETRWPVGPVSHPSVIAVYRNYHLWVHAMNEKLERDDEEADDSWGEEEDEEESATIEPHILLLENLGVVDKELGAFMEKFVAPCIGIDADGNVS